ncbi:MAG: hypothetical protein CMC56_03950 [Flavobacteriaceae bacterium]|jgi:hypothetical protein|nr:hypothetical protein [Flavobacteriaceae bacterium]
MKRIYFSFVFLLNVYLCTAQIYEIGVFGGGSNFIGDVGATTFVAPEKMAIGGLLRWNRSPRHSYRASLLYTTLSADDRKSSDPRREQRGYFFNAKVLDLSLGMEFTFLDFDLHSEKFNFSPYIFTGISLLNYPNFYFENGALKSENNRSNAFGIPLALGLKVTLTNHLIFGTEIAARYTFSDQIDGSLPNSEALSFLKFGNYNNNDWYVFSGFTLTYTFGKNPCFCSY